MNKKSQFKHLSTGTDALKQDLDSLILNKGGAEVITFNPLKEAQKKKLKKPAARLTRIKIDTSSRMEEPIELEEGRGEVSVRAKNEQAEPVLQKSESDGPGPEKEIKSRAEKAIVKRITTTAFDDFRPHSCLFSAGQLDRLRKAVYMKKATVNRKYSIKDAIARAVSMLLTKRMICENYPEDFITYTPTISMSQFEELNSFVYRIKAKKDERYAMKYAMYEALEMYLQENSV